jgi:hypothetical protein
MRTPSAVVTKDVETLIVGVDSSWASDRGCG